MHAALHTDLFARRARYRLMVPGFAAGDLELSGSDNAVHLYNRGADATCTVLAGVADSRAYLGAISTFAAGERDSTGRRTGVVGLSVAVPAGSMVHLTALPLRIRPALGSVSARVESYSAGLISLRIGGNGAVWGRERDGRQGFVGGAPVQVRVTLDDGDGTFAPAGPRTMSSMSRAGRPRARSRSSPMTGASSISGCWPVAGSSPSRQRPRRRRPSGPCGGRCPVAPRGTFGRAQQSLPEGIWASLSPSFVTASSGRRTRA